MKFKMGDKVRKTSGGKWRGTVVGTYSTELTPEGYAVESSAETGSVQIYPAKALEVWVEESALPDGWLLVPAEPSVEMLRAAQDALASEGLSVSEWMVHLTYRAAIDAAMAAKPAECGHAACKSLGEPHPFCEFAKSATTAKES